LDPLRLRRLSRPSAASLAAALAERLLFLRLAGTSSSRYITGAVELAIDMPFVSAFVFIGLQFHVTANRFNSGKPDLIELLNSVDQRPTTGWNPDRLRRAGCDS
jgi:hypothetical protein